MKFEYLITPPRYLDVPVKFFISLHSGPEVLKPKVRNFEVIVTDPLYGCVMKTSIAIDNIYEFRKFCKRTVFPSKIIELYYIIESLS